MWWWCPCCVFFYATYSYIHTTWSLECSGESLSRLGFTNEGKSTFSFLFLGERNKIQAEHGPKRNRLQKKHIINVLFLLIHIHFYLLICKFLFVPYFDVDPCSPHVLEKVRTSSAGRRHRGRLLTLTESVEVPVWMISKKTPATNHWHDFFPTNFPVKVNQML